MSCIYVIAFGNSVYITSVMPNTSDDTNLEYIELTNFWQDTVFLSWYHIKDKSLKDFVFDSSFSLKTWESQKYFRPLTKIILNNTDEWLWLYDDKFSELDTFSYVTSEKDTPIITWHVPQSQIITSTWFDLSGSLNFSSWFTVNSWSLIGSWVDLTLSWYTSSGYSLYLSWSIYDSWWVILDNQSWSINSWSILLDSWIIMPPELILDFQQPTYLLSISWSENQYACDNTKTPCKANFNLMNSFSWWYVFSQYACEIILSTWEKFSNCNPDTLEFASWSTVVSFAIYNKNNPNTKIEKDIYINNYPSLSRSTEAQVAAAETYVSNNATTTSTSTFYEVKEKPKPKAIINLQWPLWKDKVLFSTWVICRQSSICNLNFDWSKSIWAKTFNWDFGNWNTSNLANPQSLKFLSWSYMVSLMVWDEYWYTDTAYFKIDFENDPEISSVSLSWMAISNATNNIQKQDKEMFDLLFDELLAAWKKSVKIERQTNVQKKNTQDSWYEIILQTRPSLNLYRSWSVIYCKSKSECSINFAIDKSKVSDIRYIWDFWNKTIQETYNPNSVKYKPWRYILTLWMLSWSGQVIKTERLGIYVSLEANKTKDTIKQKPKNSPKKTTKSEKIISNKEKNYPQKENDNWNTTKTVWLTLWLTSMVWIIGFFARKYFWLFLDS